MNKHEPFDLDCEVDPKILGKAGVYTSADILVAVRIFPFDSAGTTDVQMKLGNITILEQEVPLHGNLLKCVVRGTCFVETEEGRKLMMPDKSFLEFYNGRLFTQVIPTELLMKIPVPGSVWSGEGG